MTEAPFTFRMRRVVADMVRQAKRLKLQQTAASLAFLSAFAAVPVFSIALSVFAASPMFSQLREELQHFLATNLFPDAFSDTLIEHLNTYAGRAGSLSLVGATVFFMTAVTALRVIEQTMNAIWVSPRRRSILARVVLYWALLTLGPLTLAIVLAANGHLIAEFLSGRDLAWARSIWVGVVTWLITVAALLLMFRSLPAARVRLSHALVGAVLSATLLAVLQRTLGWGVRSLPTYEIVYGAFAALPLVLMWLFLVWSVVLAGAVLASSLRRWDAPIEDPEPDDAPGRRFSDALTVLEALRAHGPVSVQVALPVESLREAFDGDASRLEQAGELLEQLGYVIRLANLTDGARDGRTSASESGSAPSASHRPRRGLVWEERWAWAASPETLSLRVLFENLWWVGRKGSVQAWQGEGLDRPLSRLPGP